MSNQKRPFDQMVAILFKSEGYADRGQGLVHAAVGVIGEVVELGAYTNEGHFIEEAGDLEFYLEATMQQIARLSGRADLEALMHSHYLHIGYEPVVSYDYRDIIWIMTLAAADLLDLSKKVWVYSKDPETVVGEMALHVGYIRARLHQLYSMKGVERAMVLDANQEKLGKRYPDGVHSDQHAQARLDKEGETA